MVGLRGLGGCGTIMQDFKDFTRGMFPPKPAEAAKWMFDNDPDRRREGTMWISNAPFGGSDVYLRAYRDQVKEERDPVVLAGAIRALARWGGGEDAALIEPHLAHANRHVRYEAAMGLQRLHHPPVVSALLRSLGDVDETVDVRAACATALGQYPEDRAFQGLIAALDARELAVNLAAEESLETLTGQDWGLDQSAWLAWYNAQPSAFAGAREFHYPTYARNETFFEKLVFWSSKQWEQPAPPSGVQPSSQRGTYEQEDARSREERR